MNEYFTARGDEGETSLLGQQRTLKCSQRIEAVGAVDETSSWLGMARVACGGRVNEVLLRAQRDLYALMAEMAAEPQNAALFRTIGVANLEWMEEEIQKITSQLTPLREFIIPGDHAAAATLDVARTVARRAERHAVALHQVEPLENKYILSYLNRLSSLCYVLELFTLQEAGIGRATLAKDKTK